MAPAAPLLPEPDSQDAYARLRGDPAVWLPAMRVLCERHGLPLDGLYAERTGTHVVFRAGSHHWIKLFAPLWPADHLAEAASLHTLTDRPDVPAPPLLAEGEIEGWPYLVIGHLEGHSLREVWRDLMPSEHVDLAGAIGRLLAALHETDPARLGQVVDPWPQLWERMRLECVAKHARAGADPRWIRQIESFLDGLPSLAVARDEPVFLHADVTDDHVLVSKRGGRWVVTGLIDFGDAMIGPGHYEFAAPAVFLTQRRPGPRRAMLCAYGFAEDALDRDLSRTLTAYVLLHRYSQLPDILRFCPPPAPRNVDELEQALWGFE